jgi:hypothetical protein
MQSLKKVFSITCNELNTKYILTSVFLTQKESVEGNDDHHYQDYISLMGP